jgi:Type I restriction and modification enzyme - subunit R C terminal
MKLVKHVPSVINLTEPVWIVHPLAYRREMKHRAIRIGTKPIVNFRTGALKYPRFRKFKHRYTGLIHGLRLIPIGPKNSARCIGDNGDFAGFSVVIVKKSKDVDQLDFEFVLFASAVIDYDYIMGLIARFSQQTPGKQKMSREQLVGLIQSDAKFMDEREDIAAYIATLRAGEGLSEKASRDGYTRFKAEKEVAELAGIATKHALPTAALQAFVDGILQRMIFDGEQLTDLMEPLGLNWKARRMKELDLMADLLPLLTKRAQGRDIA